MFSGDNANPLKFILLWKNQDSFLGKSKNLYFSE